MVQARALRGSYPCLPPLHLVSSLRLIRGGATHTSKPDSLYPHTIDCHLSRPLTAAMIPLSTPLRFLPLLPSELQLATVLKSGQSFRWARFETIHATKPDVAAETAGAALEDSKPAVGVQEQVQGEEWAFGWGDRTVVLRQDGESPPSTVRVKRRVK